MGKTALFVAVEHEDLECILILVRLKADPLIIENNVYFYLVFRDIGCL